MANLSGSQFQPIEDFDLDVQQAIFGGIAAELPNIISRAGGGAIAGSFVPGLGTIAGMAIGIASGVYSGVIRGLEEQRREQFQVSIESLNNVKTNLNDIISLAKDDRANYSSYLNLFKQQLAQADKMQESLKYATDTNLERYLGLGIDQLGEFEVFNSFGGERQNLETEMYLIGQGMI